MLGGWGGEWFFFGVSPVRKRATDFSWGGGGCTHGWGRRVKGMAFIPSGGGRGRGDGSSVMRGHIFRKKGRTGRKKKGSGAFMQRRGR